MLQDIIRIILAAFAIYVTGYAVRCLIFIRGSSMVNFLESIALDLGLGLGVSALLFFDLAFFKLPLTLKNMLIGITPFFIISAIFFFKNLKNNKVLSLKKIFLHKRFTPGQITLIFAICLIIILLLFYTFFLPFFEWAARSIYDFKAKILFNEKTIYTQSFLDPDYVNEHIDYPLLLPLGENWFYNCLGYYNDRLVKIFFFLIGFALILSFYSVIRKFAKRTYALIFTVFLCSTEVFIYRTYIGEADAPLAFFYFVAGSYLFLWICGKRIPYLIVSAFFISFAMFTKNEGTAFFAILTFCLFLSLLFERRKTWVQKIPILALFIIIPVIFILPWQIFKTRMPTRYVDISISEFNPINILIKFRANYARTGEIVTYFMNQILARREWQVFWILFFASQVFFVKEAFKNPLIYLTMNVWLTFLVYYINFIIIFIVPAHTLVAMTRFCLQVAPLAALLVALQIKDSKIFDAEKNI